MLNFLWQINFKRFGRYFRKNSAAKIITVALFLAVFCAVAAGIYQFFYHGFLYLKDFPYFRPALTLYSFEVFFLLIGFLVWFGSLIALLFSLFKNQRSAFIVASPKFSSLPAYSLYSSLMSSAWIFLFVLAPALWAGAVVFNTGFWAFALSILSSLLVIKFAVLLAYVLILAVAFIWRLIKKSGPSFLGLSITLAVIAIALFTLVAAKVSRHDVVVILSTQNLNLTQAPLLPVAQSFKYLPTSLAAQAVTYAQIGNLQKGLDSFFGLAGLVFLEVVLAWYLGRFFLPLWQNLSESGGIAHKQEPRRKYSRSVSGLLQKPFGAVLYKERTQLFRNPKNSFWLLFLLLLWLSYIGFSLTVQTHLRMDNSQLTRLPNIILAMQLLVLVYFVSSLVLRFVFPSFSSERNTAWIFAASPLRLGRLVWAKFWFFAVTFGAFALLAEVVNVLLLKLPVGPSGLFLTLSLSSVLALCAMGLYFGVKFANFETDDPQALGTSIPGLVFVFCSILYGALAAYSFYVFLTAGLIIMPIIFILASLLFFWVLVASAAQAVRHTDFAPQYG
ncbi:MAG: hypothetical protein P4L74_03630 [Candidatus Doudnabacteria bacterium]|nr:hypothetical protein [Candidatus Doudnabacteria bacterium]